MKLVYKKNSSHTDLLVCSIHCRKKMTNGSSHTQSGYSCLSLLPFGMPWWSRIFLALIFAVVALAGVVANSVLIYALYKTNQFVSITHKFVLFMNLSDLCSGVISLPLIIVLVTMEQRVCSFDLAMQLVVFLFGYFSLFMLMTISVDRYIHVMKLNRYNSFMNTFRMKLIIAVIIVTSVALAYLTIAIPSFYFQLTMNLSNLICVGCTFWVYCAISRKISVHSENFQRMLKSLNVSNPMKETKRELSSTKTIRLLLGALFVLYFPYNIVSLVYVYSKYSLRRDPTLAVKFLLCCSYAFVFVNSSANAVIYAYGNTAVRRFIQRQFNKVHDLANATTSETQRS